MSSESTPPHNSWERARPLNLCFVSGAKLCTPQNNRRVTKTTAKVDNSRQHDQNHKVGNQTRSTIRKQRENPPGLTEPAPTQPHLRIASLLVQHERQRERLRQPVQPQSQVHRRSRSHRAPGRPLGPFSSAGHATPGAGRRVSPPEKGVADSGAIAALVLQVRRESRA